MKKKFLIGIFGIIGILIILNFISATEFPAPFTNGGPAEKPTCDGGEYYYDNSQGKWLCSARVIGGSGSQDMYENLPPGTCIEQTCPGGDQTKCYCSKYSQGNGQVSAKNIQPTLIPSTEGFIVAKEDVAINLEEELEKEAEDCESSGDCWYKEKCFSFGTTMKGQYCGIDYSNSKNIRFMDQKQGGENCDENFECLSDNCAENQCTPYVELKSLEDKGVEKDNLSQNVLELKEQIEILKKENANLKEQLKQTPSYFFIKKNSTNSSITGNVISSFENETKIPFWKKLKDLFKDLF